MDTNGKDTRTRERRIPGDPASEDPARATGDPRPQRDRQGRPSRRGPGCHLHSDPGPRPPPALVPSGLEANQREIHCAAIHPFLRTPLFDLLYATPAPHQSLGHFSIFLDALEVFVFLYFFQCTRCFFIVYCLRSVFFWYLIVQFKFNMSWLRVGIAVIIACFFLSKLI